MKTISEAGNYQQHQQRHREHLEVSTSRADLEGSKFEEATEASWATKRSMVPASGKEGVLLDEKVESNANTKLQVRSQRLSGTSCIHVQLSWPITRELGNLWILSVTACIRYYGKNITIVVGPTWYWGRLGKAPGFHRKCDPPMS